MWGPICGVSAGESKVIRVSADVGRFVADKWLRPPFRGCDKNLCSQPPNGDLM